MTSSRALFYAMVCLGLTFAPGAAAVAAEEAGDELVQLVVGLLGDKDKDMRALALEQVRSVALGQAATQQFAAQLPKLSPDAQVVLLSALADRGDSAARPALLDLLASSREEPVRVAAIRALGSLGEPTDLGRLVQVLAGNSPAERAAAKASLARLRGETVSSAIAAEMKRATWATRAALIEILATRRAFGTVPAMLDAALDDHVSVRAAAMTAAGQLAGPEHIPGMVQGVLRAHEGAERAAAEKAVMYACRRIATHEKQAELLLAAMDMLNERDRTAILPTLGRVGGPAALEIIEAAIANTDPELHKIGIRALSNWPYASIAPRLIELAKTDENPAHRTMMLRSLIRIAPLPDKRLDSQRLELLKNAMSMCTRDAERNLVLRRARAVRILETLRFLAPYMDRAPYAQQACASVVELAHHRNLREPNKAEFDVALDKVIRTSKDATVIELANRYKKGQTWARPIAPKQR